MRAMRPHFLAPLVALAVAPVFTTSQEPATLSVTQKLEKLGELLQVQPTTPEEFQQALTDAIAVAEEIVDDPAATSEQKDQAYRPLVANLAAGAAEGLKGFRDKLDRRAKALTDADPTSDLTAFAQFFLVRLDRQSPDGVIAPDALSKTQAYVERFPKHEELTTRLLYELASSADSAADAKTALAALDLLAKSYPDHPVTTSSSGLRHRIEAVGKAFPLEATLLDGKPLDPATLKEKVVIVDFWATWCGPCIAEIPNLKKLYEDFHDKGLEIVGVSLDRSPEDVTAFLEENAVPWIQTHEKAEDGHPIADKYGIEEIPRMFLVARDGKLISTSLRGESLEAKVREIFRDDTSK